MIVIRSFADQVWTDLNSPTKEEVDSLILAQNINSNIAKDLLSPTPKQYAEESGNELTKAIYAVLHFPSFKHSHSLGLEQEIDFIITPKGLITARYDSIDALHHFAKKVEVQEIFNHDRDSHLFFGVMKEMYEFLFNEIEYMKDWIKEIEKNIFEGHEKEMVFVISNAGRNALSFKRIVGPHKGVLENLYEIGKNNFDAKFGKDARSLLGELDRLNSEIKNIGEMLDELRETNNSILSTKQNEIMKTFTVLAFITLPLSLIAATFGMSTSFIPIIDNENGFWMVLGLMLAVSLAMFAYFKYKKWI